MIVNTVMTKKCSLQPSYFHDEKSLTSCTEKETSNSTPSGSRRGTSNCISGNVVQVHVQPFRASSMKNLFSQPDLDKFIVIFYKLENDILILNLRLK